jgi:pseudouridine kinase
VANFVVFFCFIGCREKKESPRKTAEALLENRERELRRARLGRGIDADLEPGAVLVLELHDAIDQCIDREVSETVPQTRVAISRAARRLHDVGVQNVWVRRGTKGSLLSSLGERGRVTVVTLAAPPVTPVDVTGAGDAMTAAFVHALMRGDGPVDAARFGQMAAALTVASPETVRPDLTPRLIDAELRKAQPGTTQRGTTKEKA